VTEAAPLADATSGATTDKIRTEYHPRSRKRAKVCGLEEYGSEFTHRRRPTFIEPWWPDFNSQEDFLYAELVLQANMSSDISDKLIKLINRCLDGKGAFTLKGHADVENAWKRASPRVTAVSKI
jgi:hypothetical protein